MANDIKLQSPEGIHPVDENLRPLFIGDKQSAIETAQYGNGAKVVGDLEVTGDIIGNVKDITFDSVSIDQDITTLGAETFIGLDIDIDKTGASSSNPNTIKGLLISVDNATATGGGNTVVGIRTDATLTHAADSGTTAVYGGDFYATASSDGSFNEAYGVRAIAINSDTNYGVFTQVIGGDTNNIGVKIVCEDGGDDLVLHSSANIQDYFKIQTIADGETTLTTVENGGGSTAHLSMVVDGNFTVDAHADISLDAAGGDVTIRQADLKIPATKKIYFDGGTHTSIDEESSDLLRFIVGTDEMLLLDEESDKITMAATNWVAGTVSGATITEFSAENSSYAGMILGYTAIGIDATRDSVAPGNSFAITDADHKVTFVAPPSGNIEIEIRISVISVTARWLVLCLADTALGSPIDFPNSDDVTNEHTVGDIQVEGYARALNHKWVVEGLTSGTEYTWYLSAKTEQAGRVTLWWGGDSTGEFSPFIMKATALPATIYTG